MPLYRVLVTRDITESRHVKVEAPDEEEAMELAVERAHNGDGGDDPWEIDVDSCGSSPAYVTGCDPAETEPA